MVSRSFDNLAKPYHRLEVLTFGDLLQQARLEGIKTIPPSSRRALVIGDGNGHFSSELLKKFPSLRIDSIDISAKMLELSRNRAATLGPAASARINTINSDALQFSYCPSTYDLIGLNFILDCFESPGANNLLRRLCQSLKPGGLLLYSDFTYPKNPASRILTVFGIKLLYWVFRAFAKVQASELPQIVWPKPLSLNSRKTWLGGSIVAESWQKRPTARPLEVFRNEFSTTAKPF